VSSVKERMYTSCERNWVCKPSVRCRFWVKSCGRSPAVSDERGWDGRANCQMHLIEREVCSIQEDRALCFLRERKSFEIASRLGQPRVRPAPFRSDPVLPNLLERRERFPVQVGRTRSQLRVGPFDEIFRDSSAARQSLCDPVEEGHGRRSTGRVGEMPRHLSHQGRDGRRVARGPDVWHDTEADGKPARDVLLDVAGDVLKRVGTGEVKDKDEVVQVSRNLGHRARITRSQELSASTLLARARGKIQRFVLTSRTDLVQDLYRRSFSRSFHHKMTPSPSC
jgi:hypothetical protein